MVREGAALHDVHPSDHLLGVHHRHSIGIEMPKASMPCGEVSGSGGGVGGKGHGRWVVTLQWETVHKSDLRMFICNDLHVHDIEISTEVANTLSVFGLVHDLTVIALESYFYSTVHEVRNQ